MNDVPIPEPATRAGSETPTVVDLAAGPAHIVPVPADGRARYAVDLPSGPLTGDDLQDLTIALHAVSSGPAVLVDVDEYAGTVSPGDGQAFEERSGAG